jgi:hypothetical protein
MSSLALAVSKESAGESILVGSSADLGNCRDMVGPGTQIGATPVRPPQPGGVPGILRGANGVERLYCGAFASAPWSNNSYTNSR